MHTPNLLAIRALRPAWNKGRIVGQKRPLMPKHVWAIRVRLEIAKNYRDLALFNLAIDSKLRGRAVGEAAERPQAGPWISHTNAGGCFSQCALVVGLPG